jgi:hypothetical protein
MLTTKLHLHESPLVNRNSFPTEMCSKRLAIYSVQSDICSTEKERRYEKCRLIIT